MVDTVTTQIIQDGPRDLIMKFTNESDGTGEAAVLKVDVSTLVPYNGKACTGVRIKRIQYSIAGMQVKILWDATVDVPCFFLVDGSFDLNFEAFMGLTNNAGAGKTGDVLFTTFSQSAGDMYSIVLTMDKFYE